MSFKHYFVLVMMIFLLAACGKDEEVIVDEVEQTENPAEADGQEEEEPAEVESPYRYPLTGLPAESDDWMRPIAVTINNHPQARPHSGIGSADMVYELLVEGDATRYLAIFQSELPENIGPVRSARDYFINIAKGLDAVYLAHGYSPEAHQMLNSGVVTSINGMQYDGVYFDRSKARKAPHNSYITADNLKRATEKLNISLENKKNFELTFYADTDNVKMGNEAKKVEVIYTTQGSSYTSIYEYDVDSNKYKKSSPQQKTTDELTGEQVAVSNLFIFETAHKVIDSEGRRKINLTDGGRAFIFQQGTMREVKWKEKDGFLVAVEEDGSLVPLVRGQSWIHFVPSLDKSVQYNQ